jgi:hypothetical protein
MERIVWLSACVLALSLALGISSYSSTNAASAQPKYELEIAKCKDNVACSYDKARSEKFLRKLSKFPRKAFV